MRRSKTRHRYWNEENVCIIHQADENRYSEKKIEEI